MMIFVSEEIPVDNQSNLADIQNKIADYINSALQSEKSSFKFETTGSVVLYEDLQNLAISDLTSKDIFTFPFALLVLFFVIRSWRLMIIPLLTLSLSILVSFTLMYPATLYWKVVAFAPPIMMSSMLALSIDYSLFLLTRFRTEVKRSCDPEDAVKIMLKYAGRVVLVSGSTLCLTFLALAFFPFSIFSFFNLNL